jgi:hypothetical protein
MHAIFEVCEATPLKKICQCEITRGICEKIQRKIFKQCGDSFFDSRDARAAKKKVPNGKASEEKANAA